MHRRLLILLLLFFCDKSYSQSNLNYTKVEVPEISSVDVKSICDYVSHKKGGYGCVRDVIEQVMRIHGKWI